jgi:hypothetical protein
MGTVAFGLVLLAVFGLAGAVTVGRNARLARSGREVSGTVERVSPGGLNEYPPYGAWGPYIDVRYELDGRRRRATIFLSETGQSDYYPGQRICLRVSRRWPRRVRTLHEPNLAASFPLVAEVMGVFVGLGFMVWGLVRLAIGG